MRFAGAVERFVQFVFDPDVYCLCWLAIKTQFTRKKAVLAMGEKQKARAARAVNSPQ